MKSSPNTSINGLLNPSKPVLVTGGAGFVGTNVAHRLLQHGQPVIIFDNLFRRGAEKNLEWLRAAHGPLVQLDQSDIRDADAIRRAARKASRVFHFAAQVAVTTSLTDPLLDFEINARGTLNLLEALRTLDNPPPLLFTSSNKVYGNLADIKVQRRRSRYEPVDTEIRKYGFGETRHLQFHSPYGCSKGAAGQYVLDYARTFGLPAVVFHMSCIYGPHQYGNEDQGWLAHFLLRALEGVPITIFGDGRQVRDVLFVDDLVDAFLLAQQNISTLSGQAFNIGGGPNNTISLLELLELIAELNEEKANVRFSEWRSADQQFYVSDIRKFFRATGWRPKIGVQEGVSRLFRWLADESNCKGRARKPLAELTRNSRARTAQRPHEQPRSKRFWQRNAETVRAVET